MSPLPLGRLATPFDHKDWIFELKYDGFPALLHLDRGTARLLSRNGNTFSRFRPLGAQLAHDIRVRNTVLDGEICALDANGRPQFDALFYGRGTPVFVAFDLLWLNGKDYRQRPLLARKAKLSAVLPNNSPSVLHAQPVLERGTELFRLTCERDLEGIVAKQAQSTYALAGNLLPWVKIKNREYSQRTGRHELFERLRSAR